MRLRLLPWRPKAREWADSGPDLSGFDLGLDDGFLVGLVVGVVAALLLPFVLVLLVFSLELALLLLLLPLVMAGQLLGIRPWVLVLRYEDGSRRPYEVRGTRAMLAARRHFRSRIGTSALA